MKPALFSLVCALLLFGSCKDTGSSEINENTEVSEIPGTLNDDFNWTFLTHQILEIKNKIQVVDGPKSEDVKGHWYNFEGDGSYEYGIYGKTSYTGSWNYNHDRTTLTLSPNHPTENSSEWNVKWNDDMVIWVGTTTFGDNDTQMRLVRTPDLPAQN